MKIKDSEKPERKWLVNYKTRHQTSNIHKIKAYVPI